MDKSAVWAGSGCMAVFPISGSRLISSPGTFTGYLILWLLGYCEILDIGITPSLSYGNRNIQYHVYTDQPKSMHQVLRMMQAN